MVLFLKTHMSFVPLILIYIYKYQKVTKASLVFYQSHLFWGYKDYTATMALAPEATLDNKCPQPRDKMACKHLQ